MRKKLVASALIILVRLVVTILTKVWKRLKNFYECIAFGLTKQSVCTFPHKFLFSQCDLIDNQRENIKNLLIYSAYSFEISEEELFV